MCRKHATTKTEFSQFVAFCVQEKTMEPKFGWITPMFWHISINPTYSCFTNVRPVLKPLLKKWQFMITERRFILILKLMSRYVIIKDFILSTRVHLNRKLFFLSLPSVSRTSEASNRVVFVLIYPLDQRNTKKLKCRVFTNNSLILVKLFQKKPK